MSNLINERLYERAAEMIDYWQGTIHAKLIEADLDRNDLEQLRVDVNKAWDAMHNIEYKPNEVLAEDVY